MSCFFPGGYVVDMETVGRFDSGRYKMDVVDVITRNSKYTKGNKLIKLYAVVMLNYRQPLGDKAWAAIGRIFGDDTLTDAFSFLMGFASGSALAADGALTQKFEKFVQSDMKELDNGNIERNTKKR